MWFIFDESLSESDLSAPLVRSALERLLYSVASGEHAIAGSPTVLQHLSKGEISPRPKEVLRHALANAPDFLARVRAAKFRIRVTRDGSQPSHSSEGEWSLPLHWIHENGVPLGVILAENLRDARLYRECAQHHAIIEKVGTPICLDLANGGGADTPRVLEEEAASQRRFVICITDSDRCCPQSPLNHTSRECARIAATTQWVVFHLALEEREIENVVPQNILKEVVYSLGSPEMQSRYESLLQLGNRNTNAWAFLDLKEGTPLKTMFGDCENFWSPFKSHAVCTAHSRNECIDGGQCAASSREDCECLIAPSLGQRVLDHTLQFLNERSPHESAKRARSSDNIKRWLDIGAWLSAWGAAMPKVRS